MWFIFFILLNGEVETNVCYKLWIDKPNKLVYCDNQCFCKYKKYELTKRYDPWEGRIWCDGPVKPYED